MLTLSKGFKKPQTGDKGSVFFPAMEANIQQLNDHDHDGTDSAKIIGGNISNGLISIAAVDWVAFGSGYRVLVTLPTGYAYDDTHKEFRIDGGPNDGALVFPTVVKDSSSTMYVHSNDNTIALKVSVK